MLENFVVYVLSAFLILGTLAVVLSRNPVYSVLFLIFSFFNAAGIFVFLKAEFLAMVLIIVYVGAVAVLFLFVVMLINVKEVNKKHYFSKYVLFSALLVIVLGAEFLFLMNKGFIKLLPNNNINYLTNNLVSIKSFGVVLFEQYYYVFVVSALILMVAMIGAIVLSGVEDRKPGRRQNPFVQNNRSKENSVSLLDVKKEEGLK
jgi:NADH-quinone oxidoreductase subunit J